jgi:hypothetical protein
LDGAEDLPPRRAIALPPEEYLADLRTPAPELVLAEYRRQMGSAAVPASVEVPVEAVEDIGARSIEQVRTQPRTRAS